MAKLEENGYGYLQSAIDHSLEKILHVLGLDLSHVLAFEHGLRIGNALRLFFRALLVLGLPLGEVLGLSFGVVLRHDLDMMLGLELWESPGWLLNEELGFTLAWVGFSLGDVLGELLGYILGLELGDPLGLRL